jgi:hypothetical protein
MAAIIKFQVAPSTGRLAEAERIAGVRTVALRDPEYAVIDVCHIDTSDMMDRGESLCSQCAEEIGSKSLRFGAAGGSRTLVSLSFDEAGLTTKLFMALRKQGHEVEYVNLF